jgi:EsV-1-7 cysteine-rich motif
MQKGHYRCLGGCDKRPVFNVPGARGGRYCKFHRVDGMIDVANRSCADNDCSSQPSYNWKGAKTGVYCVLHMADNMVNVKVTNQHGDRCTYKHCANPFFCNTSTYRNRASHRRLAEWCMQQLSA